MIVEIHYRTNEPGGKFRHMANVTVEYDTIEAALESAFYHTQNIRGSWSCGPLDHRGEINLHYFEGTEVLVPLEVIDGETYGHRSSTVGDKFIINGESYIVDIVGFTKESEYGPH